MANLRTDVSVDVAGVAGAGEAGVTGGAMRILGHPVATISMKLQMMRGSFLPADAGPAMDPKVWRRLPENMVLEVAQRVPSGVSQFRLQSVSSAWRSNLASAHLRTRVAAPASEQEQQERQGRVVVAHVGRCSKRSNRNVIEKQLLKLLDIDLASFVPSSFWITSPFHSRSYAVVAAAHGLVCITSSKRRPVPYRLHKFCVLNPLTRTCKVLPPVPFEPEGWVGSVVLTPDAITFFRWRGDGTWARGMCMATYDLKADTGNWNCAAYRSQDVFEIDCAAVALCAGETFAFFKRRLHVLAPGPDGLTLVDVGELEQPSLELLGMDASLYYDPEDVECMKPLFTGMQAHRGAILLFMAQDARLDGEVDMLMGVWRLVRESLQWEAVARLDVAELERLTGLKGLNRPGACELWGPCAVQDSLWLRFKVGCMPFGFWLSFNLDTGGWELAHGDKQALLHHGASSVQHEQETVSNCNCISESSMPFELRPDLFL